MFSREVSGSGGENAVSSGKLLQALIGLVVGIFIFWVGRAQGSEGCESGIRPFLQGYLSGYNDLTTRYSFASVPLEEGKQDAVVYLSSQGWCGSGGCTALILECNKSWYKVIQRLTLARLPIVVLSTKTNGWHDISMPVGGGGIVTAYTGVLKFDGKKYVPVSSASQSSGHGTEGFALPLNNIGDLLYP